MKVFKVATCSNFQIEQFIIQVNTSRVPIWKRLRKFTFENIFRK